MKDSKYKEVPWMTGRWKKLATTSNRGFAPQSTCKYKQWLCSEKQYDDRVNTENSKHRLNVETPSLHNPYAKRRWKDVSQLVFRSVVFLLSWKFGLDTSLSEKLYRVCYIPHDGGFFFKTFLNCEIVISFDERLAKCSWTFWEVKKQISFVYSNFR